MPDTVSQQGEAELQYSSSPRPPFPHLRNCQMKTFLPICFLIVLNVAVFSDPALSQEPSTNEPSASQPEPSKSDGSTQLRLTWEQSIRPLISKNCLECHTTTEHSGKLEMETIEGLVRGGLSGSAVDHKNPTSSLLLEVLAPKAKKHMPPEGQLTDDEIGLITQWLEGFKQNSLPKEWQAASENRSEETEQSTAPEKLSDPISSLPLGLNPSQVIDLALQSGWQANNVAPAGLTTDAAFARRLYLDLVGRIPLESELQLFINNADSRKREQLVDTLLISDEHSQHLAEVLNAVLMGRRPVGNGGGRNGRRERNNERTGWMEYLTSAVHDNRPWNAVAREIILARPTKAEDRGAVWYLYSRQNKHQDIAEAISKDFFGVRIDCAQCHDHPLASEIEQRHYWGLVAFFNRSNNVDSPDGPRVAESAIGGFSEFTNVGGKSAENKLVYLRAKPIEEARPAKDVKEEDREDLYLPAADGEPKVPKFSRRQQFVDQVLEGNPLVAEAMVNRMWGWMFGRGIVHPVDALDSFHPASHPGLLDWLARDFEHSNYDVRRLIRSIALSRAYQLQSTATVGADPKWFASAIAKPLTAESLYRSLLVALDVTDPTAWNAAPKRAEFANLFPDVLTEESLANVSQGLWLTNSEPIREMVSAENSKVVQRVAAIEKSDQLVERLFQLIMGRNPDGEETTHCVEFLNARPDHRQAAIESLTWALVTSAEFRFNH